MSFIIPEIFKNRKDIWNGLKNRLIKNEDVEQVYKARMQICENCKLYSESSNGCLVPGTQPCCDKTISEFIDGVETFGCGCSLSLKGRSLSSSCPLKKWDSILTLQEENILNSQLNDKR